MSTDWDDVRDQIEKTKELIDRISGAMSEMGGIRDDLASAVTATYDMASAMFYVCKEVMVSMESFGKALKGDKICSCGDMSGGSVVKLEDVLLEDEDGGE